MLAATLVDTLTVYSMTIAFQSDSSGFVSIISYVIVIYAFLADCFVFKEQFTWVELVGAACILIVTVYTSIVKLREKDQQPEEDD